jgi:hypothetical protein
MDGIRESSYPELNVENIDFDSLREKVEKLLNVHKLKVISKATRLQLDGERLYCESKILSDIRPVFDDDPEVDPIGAVITHTLKLGYHIGREHKEFHIVLDADDLESLKSVIDRAYAKNQTLRVLLRKKNLPNLGV